MVCWRGVLAATVGLTLVVGCDGGAEPAARRPTTSATVQGYGAGHLDRALLPAAQLPGFDEIEGGETVDPGKPVDVAALMPLKGLPAKCRGGMVELRRLGRGPIAEAHYGRKSTFVSEALMALPAGARPPAPRIPPGCDRQDGRMQGVDAYARLRMLKPRELPSLPAAEVAGVQVDFHEKVAGQRMMSYRIVQARSNTLLMLVVTATDGNIAKATDDPVTAAWRHATRELN